MGKIHSRLIEAVGDRVRNDDNVKAAYGYPMVFTDKFYPPSEVVKAKSPEEVSEVLKIANEENIAVYPRGNATDLADGTVAQKPGSIVMDLKGMNDVIEVDPERRVVVAETGITFGKLNKYLLENYGQTTGILGSANATATLGGGISNNSVGGGGEPLFHNPGEHTVGMEVVLPTGEIVNLGGPGFNRHMNHWFGGRYLAGPDLAGLFIGDPGTLGIKTKIAMRTFPMPEGLVAKTVLVPGDPEDYLASSRRYVEIDMELERKADLGLGYGSVGQVYLNQAYVSAAGGCEVFEPWARLRKPTTGEGMFSGAFCYICAGASEEDALGKIRMIDDVCVKYDCKQFGPEISEGNFARWLFEKNGGCLYSHPAWYLGLGPIRGGMAFVYDMPWDTVMPCLEAVVNHYNENRELYTTARATSPCWFLAPVGGGIKYVEAIHCRQNSIPRFEKVVRAQERIFDEKHRAFLEAGGTPIWKGQLYAAKMAKWNIFGDGYFNLLRRVKETLDPRGILSPGEFRFNTTDEIEERRPGD